MAKIKKRTWTSGGEEKTAWVADYFDQAGKRRLKTFKTRKAADAWLVAARGEVAQGTHTPASASPTVAQAGEDWIAQGETDGLERSTLAQYRQHLDYHIKPFIGAVRLAELTPAMVQDFRNTLIREGRSRVMAKRRSAASARSWPARWRPAGLAGMWCATRSGIAAVRTGSTSATNGGSRLALMSQPRMRFAPCSLRRRAAGDRLS
jgi:hypothetical protein